MARVSLYIGTGDTRAGHTSTPLLNSNGLSNGRTHISSARALYTPLATRPTNNMKQDTECKDKQRLNRNRKFSKPMMERRRRARINDSLNELKTLVLSAMEKDPSRYNKMEKADILEITVNFLKGYCATEKNDIDHRAQFCAGYSECSREIQSYLLMANDVSPQVKATMLSRITLANPATAHDKNAARLHMANAAVYPSSSSSSIGVFDSGAVSPSSISPNQPCIRFTYPSPPASPMSGSLSPAGLPITSLKSAFNEVSTSGKRKCADDNEQSSRKRRYSQGDANENDRKDNSESSRLLWRPW